MNQDPEDVQDQGTQQRNEEEYLVAAGNEPRVSHSDADGRFKTNFLLMFNAYMLNHFMNPSIDLLSFLVITQQKPSSWSNLNCVSI